MDKDLIQKILKDYSKVVQNETNESRLDRIESKIDEGFKNLERLLQDK